MVVIKKPAAGRITASPARPHPAPQTTAPPVKSSPGHIQRVKACRECSWRYHLAVYFKECPNCGAKLRSMEWTEGK